jgi:hypothetical protein
VTKNLQVLVNRNRTELNLLIARREEMDRLIREKVEHLNRLKALGYERGEEAV